MLAPNDRYFDGYDDLTRWNSYWCQIESVKKLPVKKILEIGIGNKTVSRYLYIHGYDVTTLDINKNLRSDVVGEITELPFISNKFDAVLCCEVLEHIPFEKVEAALKEIGRISRYVIISLPNFNVYLSITMDTNVFYFITRKRFKPRNLVVKLPFPLKHKFDGAHYWEIGKKGYSIKMIRELFKKCGLKILEEKIPSLNVPHHFFILQKRKQSSIS